MDGRAEQKVWTVGSLPMRVRRVLYGSVRGGWLVEGK